MKKSEADKDIKLILQEAQECLETAMRKEKLGDYEAAIEIRAAKTIFTHYYGPLLISLVESVLDDH
jgi:hypothetical protein